MKHLILFSLLLIGCGEEYTEYAVFDINRCDASTSPKLHEFVIECMKTQKSDVESCTRSGTEIVCPMVKVIKQKPCFGGAFLSDCSIIWRDYMDYNDPQADPVKRIMEKQRIERNSR